jgi:Ras GTPase-activating-like protein IQGAP2/3
MVDQPIGQVERRNLAAVANLLTHVAAQEDPSSLKDRFVRVPLQEYIKSEGPIFRDWIMDGMSRLFLADLRTRLIGSCRC